MSVYLSGPIMVDKFTKGQNEGRAGNLGRVQLLIYMKPKLILMT